MLGRDDEMRRTITRLREAIQGAIAALQHDQVQDAKYILMDAMD